MKDKSEILDVTSQKAQFTHDKAQIQAQLSLFQELEPKYTLLINNVCVLSFAWACLKHLSEPASINPKRIHSWKWKKKSSEFVLIPEDWKRKKKTTFSSTEKS